LRKFESQERLGIPADFASSKNDNLYRLFISAQQRGSGVAATLIVGTEAILAAKDLKTGWLSWVNARAEEDTAQ